MAERLCGTLKKKRILYSTKARRLVSLARPV